MKNIAYIEIRKGKLKYTFSGSLQGKPPHKKIQTV